MNLHFSLSTLLVVTIIASANAFLPSSSGGSSMWTTKTTSRGLQQSSRAIDGTATGSSTIQSTTAVPDEISDVTSTAAAAAVEFSMDNRVGLSPNKPMKTNDIWSTPREFTPFQQFARIAPLVTMAAYAINPEPLDVGVQNFWNWILSWDVTHTRLFEAHVAVFSFSAAIIFFSVLHLILDEETVKKFRLDGQMPKENPLAFATLQECQLFFNPVISYLASIWIYQQIFHTYNQPPLIAPTFGALVVEVAFGVFLYDLCFAPIHIFMHKGPLKEIRSVHGYHHRHTNGALNSQETVQHSYIDGTLQVMTNIFVQHISPFGGPKHTLSRIIHNIMVTYMLSESHSGYNFSWMTHNIWPEFLGGSPRHERHHKDGRVYYQQFFMYLDDMLGFNDQDVAAATQQKQQQFRKKLEEEEQQSKEQEQRKEEAAQMPALTARKANAEEQTMKEQTLVL